MIFEFSHGMAKVKSPDDINEGLEKLIHPSQVLPVVQVNKLVAAGRSQSGKRCLLQERDTIEKRQ